MKKAIEESIKKFDGLYRDLEKTKRPMHFDYTASKAYCESLGLVWLGDDFVRDADTEAWVLGFDQTQVEGAMKHHLLQVRWLFTPSNYRWYQRLFIALYFLTGWKLK